MQREYKLLLVQLLYNYVHEKQGNVPDSDSLLIHSPKIIKDYCEWKGIKCSLDKSTEIKIASLCELVAIKINKES